MSSQSGAMQNDEESRFLLSPADKKQPESHARSGRASAFLATGAVIAFLCLGFLGYSGTNSGESLGSHIRHASLSVADVLSATEVTETATVSCSKIFSVSLSDLKTDLRSCKQSIDEGATIGATVPFCMGSSSDCTEAKADNIIIGTASASGTITPDAATQALEVSGNFGLGSFLYVIGNVLGGQGGTLRSLIGELANISLDGTLTVELETNANLETGLTVGVVGAISVQNDISCKDPLSCTLYQLVSDTDRNSKPKDFSKLGALDFSYKFTVENIDVPAEWEVEVSVLMAGTTIVKNKAWLKGVDGAGPSLYVKLTPEDPPAVGIFMPLEVCVQNCKSAAPTDLNFVGTLELDGVTMAGTLKFNSWWEKAFGIPILNLGHLQVGLAVPQASPTVINAISIGGRFCLGRSKFCVPAADGTLADGLSIAGAAYMGVNFNPEESDDNYVFAAITETTLEKILLVFEDGMNFPKLRDSIPPPLLESSLLPYKTKKCTPQQEADFVNNVDCFATMSFSPGGDVQLTPDLVVSQGTSVSARVDFMGSQMQMKLAMNTDPAKPYLKMIGSMTPITVMNVVTLTKSKGNAISGPGLKMDCDMTDPRKLKCGLTGSGYVKIPALALTGNFAMTVKPQLPSSMITTIDFSSKMFGTYDMDIQAMYNGPKTTYLDLEMSLSASGRTDLANAMGKLAKKFLEGVDALTSDGQDFADGVSKSLKRNCKDVDNKKFSVGPVSVGGYKMKKHFKFDLKFEWPFDFVKFDKTWEHTWGEKVEFIPKLETSVRDECENYAEAVSVPFQKTVNGLMIGLDSLAKEAKSAFKALSDASKFFVMKKFTFAVHFDAANTAADMLLDLDMVVSKIPVVLKKFKVRQDADLAKIIYDQVIKQAFPNLQNQLKEMQDIVNNMGDKITDKANEVAGSATKLFNKAKDVLIDKAEDAEKKVADKLEHYKNKCKDWLEDKCKDVVDGIIPKELGGCGWCKKKCSEAFD